MKNYKEVIRKLSIMAVFAGKRQVRDDKYVVENPNMNIDDVIDFLSPIGVDIQDLITFSYSIKGRVFFQLVGNMDHKFVIVHAYGDMKEFNSYEVYDQDGEELDYGEIGG